MVEKDLKKKFLICVLALIVIIGGVLYYQYRGITHPLNSNKGRVNFTVDKSEDINKVIGDLSNKKIISKASLLKWYINKNYNNVLVKKGNYSFSNNIKLGEFINYMKSGIIDDRPVKITIPEGYNVEQIAAKLDKDGIISKEDFISSCKSYKYPSFVKNDSKRRYLVEGYLFPDTYKFLKGSSGDYIIKTMLDRFSQVVDEIEKKDGKKFTNDELDRMITMASIVEKEVEKPEERGEAASVFYNRLNKKMKLQSCATVLYSMNKYKNKLYYKDLKFKSPYNTYIVSGLPQGPISNPGRGCIEAAVNPKKTNYLYFVSNNNGTQFFTSDINEFLKVKQFTQGN